MSAATRRRLAVQPLEKREVLASAVFATLASDIQEYLNDLQYDHEELDYPGHDSLEHDHDDQDHDDHDHLPTAPGGGGDWNPGTPLPIAGRVLVQPIVVSNTDGSNTAEFLGSTAQQAEIEDYIDQVWAQAGIDIDWLAPNTLNNTFANVGSGSPSTARPTSDLSSIVSIGDSAGVTHPDSNVLNMFFVQIAAGFEQLNDSFANGLAYVGGNGSTLHIGDSLVSFEAGQQTIARVVAHEIGHNLGLEHIVSDQNLMDNGALLNNDQTATALSSVFVAEVSNNAPVVASALSNLSVTQDAAPSTIGLSSVFSDPDGDALSFAVTDDNGSLLSSSISGSDLILSFNAGMSGSANITVTASDPLGAEVSDSFEVTVNPTVPTTTTDLGEVTFSSTSTGISNIAWLEFTASQGGFLTAGTEYVAAAGDINLSLFDSSMNLLADGVGSTGSERADVAATPGATYYLRLLGTNPSVELNVQNLVSVAGATVSANGSAGTDTYGFQAGSTHALTVNGFEYSFAASSTSGFAIAASGGSDSVTLEGLSTIETASFEDGSVDLTGVGFNVLAAGEVLTVLGGSNDEAFFTDSSGNDVYNANSVRATFTYASGNTAVAEAFGETTALSTTGGEDSAFLFDGAGNEVFTAGPISSSLVNTTGQFSHFASRFENVYGYSLAGGVDSANFEDSSGDDLFVLSEDDAFLQPIAGGFFNQAFGFANVTGTSSTGNDSAVFYDSTANDSFTSTPVVATLQSATLDYQAANFRFVYGYSENGGVDSATLVDSGENDTFFANPVQGFMSGPSHLSFAAGFDSVVGRSTTGGADLAIFHDSSGDDVLSAAPGNVNFTGAGFANSATDFEQVFTLASTGNDTATFTDTSGDETFAGGADFAYMQSTSTLNYAGDFDTVTATSTGGSDTAVLHDSTGNDQFVVSPTSASMTPETGGFLLQANGFAEVFGFSLNGGSDSAILTGGVGDDNFVASSAFSSMTGTGYESSATGFATVSASGGSGGSDVASLFDSAGDDQLIVAAAGVTFVSDGIIFGLTDFSFVAATSSAGGTDDLTEEAVDYLFEAFGSWI